MSQEVTTATNTHAVPSDNANAMISVIERAALNPDVDIEKMERLLSMQERIIERQSETEFNAAMAEMQCKMPSIAERGKIVVKGETRSHYATFEDINDVVKPIMQEFGFAMSFRVEQHENGINVTGILMHRSGHREQTSMFLPLDQSGAKNVVQSVGSSVSYGKRYVMSAMLNITTRGEDDDGNSAAPRKTIDAGQVEQLTQLLDKCPDKTREWFEKKYGSAAKVPFIHFAAIRDQLRSKLNASKEGRGARLNGIIESQEDDRDATGDS